MDTGRHEVEMTFRQIQQKFNKAGDNIPEKMAEQAKGPKAGQKKFKVLHCIFPREDSKRLSGRKDGSGMPVASLFISMDFQEVIRESGYHENPLLCRRFKKWASAWGYGPCYLALPDSRQVNYVQEYMDTVAELHANPRVLFPSNLEGDVDLRAGGVTTFDPMVQNGKPEEWASVSDYKLGLEMQAGRRQSIRDACYTDAFKLLNSAPLLDKEMTAYEISQRQAEQLQNMTPIDARHIPEFHNPLMLRGFGIMYRRGKLGKAPASLMVDAGGGKTGLAAPEVLSTSRFSDALKALKNRGAEETFGFIAKLPGADQHPEYMDPFDLDKSIVGYARNAGMAPDDIRPATGPNSVAAIRAKRTQIIQQQRAAAMAEQLGKAGKGLGGSPQWMQDQAQDGFEKATGKGAAA